MKVVLRVWLSVSVLLLLSHHWIWSSSQEPKEQKNGSLHVFSFHYPFCYCMRVVIGLSCPPYWSFRRSILLQSVAQQAGQFQQFTEIGVHRNVHNVFKVFYCNIGQLCFCRRLITLWICLWLDVDQQLSNKRCSKIAHTYCPNIVEVKNFYY